jgi:hypothetical protein
MIPHWCGVGVGIEIRSPLSLSWLDRVDDVVHTERGWGLSATAVRPSVVVE